MSVNKQDIDLKKALEASAGKVADKPTKNASVPSDLSSALLQSTNDVKKKVPSPEPSKEPLDGAAPGTTNTTNTIKWEDNPLNPVKAVNDYEAKRDKTPEILFKDEDKSKLGALITKYGVAPASSVFTNPLVSSPTPSDTYTTPVFKQQAKVSTEIDYESAANVVNAIKTKLDNLKVVRQGQRGMKKSSSEEELEKDLVEAQKLKRKAFNEMVVNGDKQVEVLSRQDDSGNSFKRTMQDIFGSKPGGWQTEKPKIENKLATLPTQFLTGLNILKGTEPAEYERLTDNISNGLPISQSQIAKITNLGINLEEAKLQRDILKSPVTKAERETVAQIYNDLETVKTDIEKYEGMIKAKQPLSPEQIQDYKSKINQYNGTVTKYKPLIEKVNTVYGGFAKRANELQEARRKNLIDNPEVLRSFIADGIATRLDESMKILQGKNRSFPEKIGEFMLGHTWNYSDEQIKAASEAYLKEQGIDPTTPQVQAAIKFLQENEGVMIGENSVAKAGGFRELGMGAVGVIEGILQFIEAPTRSINDVYTESQSQGNVKVARKRLEAEDKGVRGVMNEVMYGTGQFAAQAISMGATSGAVGIFAKGIMGRSGVKLLADAKAAGIKPSIPFDDATANIAFGNVLMKIKDPLAVWTTSYAISYPDNLKAMLSYTSDDDLAKNGARLNASLEGTMELWLSPLSIAKGIINKFSRNQPKNLLKILSDKSLKNDPTPLKQYIEKVVKGVLATGKVTTAEVLEELPIQIADYVSNMYLNPESDSFKNRNLRQELMTTAYQTGLSMALPALLNGIGAAKANSFSKGSLLISAQNRQAMIDDLNKDLALNKITQQQANQQIQLINTAAEVNADIPRKANGVQMDTNEKANYVWSRVTEAYMDKKLASTTDKAQEEIWRNKIKEQQEYRKQILGLTEAEPEVPEYTIDDKPVDRKEFLETAEAKPAEHNYVVTGDEEAQQVIRNIGGIDDENNKPPEKKGIPTDDELVKAIESKNVQGYTKTDIKELKEQALQAPASFKNQFGDDEATTISLIAKNSTDKINQAIEYQQERLKEPDIDENDIEAIDNHIKLLEQGLKQREEFFPEESIKEKEGKPLSKLEQLKAKRLLSKEDVPGETIDQKLKYISEQPENFGNDLVALAEKRFPKETTPTEVKGNQVLTKEAQDLLASIGEGSKPTFITKNLEKIAKDNGIEVTNKMSADDVINALKEKQTKGKDVVTEKPTPSTGLSRGDEKVKEVDESTDKQRKRTIVNHLLDSGGDVDGAFEKAGYVNHNGIWVAPEALEYAKKVSPEAWQHMKDKGIRFLEGGDDSRGLQKVIAYGDKTIRGIGINERVGEFHSGHDHTVLHETAHHVWQEELTPEQREVFADDNPVSDYAKSVKEGNEKTMGKYDEEDFAELYAKNKGDINKAIEEKKNQSLSSNTPSKKQSTKVEEQTKPIVNKEAKTVQPKLQKEKPIIEETEDYNDWMQTMQEYENDEGFQKFYGGMEGNDRIAALSPHKVAIKDALNDGSIEKAVSSGKISRERAIEIINSAELELPQFLQEEPKIKDVNLNKQIDLLSADFLDINKPEIAPSSQRIKIVDVPLSSISTDTSSFQNRETEFSQESVDKILKAVQEDNFNWTEFDPVTLWKNDNNLFMLSGHSRLEAFKRLTTMGYAGFDTIPSEIFEGTKEDAIAIALRSNTLSTKETPIERAGYYRDARLKGVASRSILNEAKDYEGRNALTIIALSYLNPKGKAIADLKALGQEGDTKSKANSLQMARWVGEVRQQFPQVTDAHENEIYDWLKAGAYAKIKNLAEISSRINNVVSGFDFDAEKPLNLEHRATKSYVDETYEQQLSDKEKQIKEQQKLISDKATKYNEAQLTPQEVAEKLVPDNAILARMQQDYIKLKDKKGAISEANKGILSLFDNIQTEIDNGTITEQQAESFINTTDEIEESDPIIEDIERNAESEITASQAIEEGIELINGENVIKNREVKAEKKLAEKVSVLEKEKTARINEITKPELNMNTLLINDLFTMAATNEANRQEYEDIKSQFFSLKNLFDCLFA